MLISRKNVSILSLALILAAISGSFFVLRVFASQNATINATVKVSVCGNGIKETREQCDDADFGPNICTTYSFSGGSLACQPSCELNTSGCTTSAEDTATPLFFTGVGGTYEVEHSQDDGSIEVSLPPDYYSQDVRLQMFVYDNAHFAVSKPAPGNLSFIGKTYDLVFINEDGFVVSSLAQVATVTLTYDEESLGSIDEVTLQPYRWGAGDGSWQAISGAVLNTANNTVTFSSIVFSSFALFGSPPASTPAPTPSGGGGGGGGLTPSQPVVSAVEFSGTAFPTSTVVILKDAQKVAEVVADEEGRFFSRLNDLAGGTYTFSVYALGAQGRRSTLTNVSMQVTPGTTYQKNDLLLSPTVTVDKLQVKQGEIVSVSGRAPKRSEVALTLHSSSDDGQTFLLLADDFGFFRLFIDSTLFKEAVFYVDAVASVGGQESPRSRTASFEVGDVTLWNVTGSPLRGDINSDGRINLIDFSIMAYWYKRANPAVAVDLNEDGKVDLVDVSILAFYWTG